MNCSKTIHVLLVAALFLSQLAASIHVTGHLHEAEHENDHVHATHAHAAHHHGAGLSTSHAAHLSAAEHSHAHSHAHPDFANPVAESASAEHNEERIECEIFHLLLNLNGGFLVTQNQPLAPYKSTPQEAFVSTAANYGTADNYKIRAPPSIS